MWDLIVSVPDHCLSFYFSHDVAHMSPSSDWEGWERNLMLFKAYFVLIQYMHMYSICYITHTVVIIDMFYTKSLQSILI